MPRFPRATRPLVATVASAVLLLAGCSGSEDGGSEDGGAAAGGGSGDGARQAPDAGVAVTVRSTELGEVLADASGRTLYTFSLDEGSASKCDDQCLRDWPVAKAPAEGEPVGAREVTVDLAAADGTDGSSQLTANGQPLYRYAGDAKPGQVKGQGLDTHGGLWWVVGPDGEEITAKPGGGEPPADDQNPEYDY